MAQAITVFPDMIVGSTAITDAYVDETIAAVSRAQARARDA
jgi:hypothetical protein